MGKMKKVMLILILAVWCSTANAAWFSGADKQEPKVGHTWKANDTGICYDITLVEKDCIKASANWSNCKLTSTRKGFLEDYTFVCQPEKPAEKPEIVAGQIWKDRYGGDERLVFDVSKKYVIYGYKNESDIDFPSIRTKEKFLKSYELIFTAVGVVILDAEYTVEAVEETEHGYIYTIEKIPEKPYLHKNPNNDHWICSKHGDLMPDYDKDSGFFFTGTATITYYGSDIYCYICFGETLNKVLSQHITGVKENDYR